MRVLLDTCIVIYLTAEPDRLSKDVRALIEDYDTQLCMSIESVRELIVAYNDGGIVSKRWKTSEDMLRTSSGTVSVDLVKSQCDSPVHIPLPSHEIPNGWCASVTSAIAAFIIPLSAFSRKKIGNVFGQECLDSFDDII